MQVISQRVCSSIGLLAMKLTARCWEVKVFPRWVSPGCRIPRRPTASLLSASVRGMETEDDAEGEGGCAISHPEADGASDSLRDVTSSPLDTKGDFIAKSGQLDTALGQSV